MIFVSSKEREHMSALLEADSVPGVRAVMNVWYSMARRGENLPVTLVIDAYMQAHEWERAISSIERTYGRDSRPHRFMLQMLEAAARQSRLLSEGVARPPQDAVLPGMDLGRVFGR